MSQWVRVIPNSPKPALRDQERVVRDHQLEIPRYQLVVRDQYTTWPGSQQVSGRAELYVTYATWPIGVRTR